MVEGVKAAEGQKQAVQNPPVDKVDPPAQQPADGSIPASGYGMQKNGDFVIMLGGHPGFRIPAEDYKAMKKKALDFTKRTDFPRIRGLTLEKASIADGKIKLEAALAFPSVDMKGGIKIWVSKDGAAAFSGKISRKINVPAVGSPELTVSIGDKGVISGTASVNAVDLLPKGLGKEAKATGSATLTASAGELTGEGQIDLGYPQLGSASFSFKFENSGVFTASGMFTVTPPFLNKIEGKLSVDKDKNLTANAKIEIASHKSPIPALQLTAGTIEIGYANGKPTATLADFAADYRDFASVAITTATLSQGCKFSGAGSFKLIVPALAETSGTVGLKDGKVSGSLKVDAKKFPKGVPVTNGSITATLSEQGTVAFNGSVAATFGKAGTGNVEASYSPAGQLNLGVVADITVPGLQPVHVVLAYKEGLIEGEVGVPINSEIIPGLTGNVTVRYKDQLWSGETNLAYSADNGKLSGNVLVTVAQKEDGSLALGGSGSVTAQIAPRLSGTLTATILEEGGVDVSGAITVTEPLELFPEKRIDKELFKFQKNIPLWAILVAVIRIRAGIRAGIGPGVFRNIKVEGSYTFGSEEADPSFTISGELFIPAFVEGYIAFGAGLGLDVLLGSLTGGIEAVGTAGLYGAISVIPELSYADGDWGIEGTATMAAGARLKLGLNAWAEVEALWVTVWENEWKLAEHVMEIGPDLALQAHMSYKFGSPEPPELDFKTSDIDSESLIQSAMPEDGPAPSGARDALENKAEWKGALKEQRKAPVPPETAAEAKTAEPVPAAPPKPGKKPGPPAGGAKATGEGENQDPGANPTPGNEPARSKAVDDAAKTDTSVQGSVPEDKVLNADTVRYPNPITLSMLDEPPAPLPRTHAQEQEDVDAAKKALDLAIAVADDSNQLDNFFPRIKSRFGLAKLGYEGDFSTGFDIIGEINPNLKIEAREPLNSTGLPTEGKQTHKTKIGYGYASLTSGGSAYKVGIQMTAFPLGPEHPQGGPPKDQEDLMSILPSDPGNQAHLKFIRGHLLNDNLGGPGESGNLFPITASANKEHSRLIEETVKNWVNIKKFWVKYTVDVTTDGELKTIRGGGGLKKVDSTIKVKAAVLNMQLDEVPKFTVSENIVSKYTESSKQDKDAKEFSVAALAEHDQDEVRDVDRNTTAKLSTRSEDQVYTFPDNIKKAIAYGRAAGNTFDDIKIIVQGYVGFGEGKADLLIRTYQMVSGGEDNTLTGLTASEKALFTLIVSGWGSEISRDVKTRRKAKP